MGVLEIIKVPPIERLVALTSFYAPFALAVALCRLWLHGFYGLRR